MRRRVGLLTMGCSDWNVTLEADVNDKKRTSVRKSYFSEAQIMGNLKEKEDESKADLGEVVFRYDVSMWTYCCWCANWCSEHVPPLDET